MTPETKSKGARFQQDIDELFDPANREEPEEGENKEAEDDA